MGLFFHLVVTGEITGDMTAGEPSCSGNWPQQMWLYTRIWDLNSTKEQKMLGNKTLSTNQSQWHYYTAKITLDGSIHGFFSWFPTDFNDNKKWAQKKTVALYIFNLTRTNPPRQSSLWILWLNLHSSHEFQKIYINQYSSCLTEVSIHNKLKVVFAVLLHTINLLKWQKTLPCHIYLPTRAPFLHFVASIDHVVHTGDYQGCFSMLMLLGCSACKVL